MKHVEPQIVITVRTAAARLHLRRGDSQVWQCVPVGGFGSLLELEDEYLPPDARFLARQVAETLLYLCSGSLVADASATGERVTLLAGAFQRVAGAPAASLRNASLHERARIFRIVLRAPDGESESRGASAWFTAAERRGRLRLVASSESEGDALSIPHDVLIYSALLDPGQHVVCELATGRCAWLHMVRGSATVLGKVLDASDSAEIRDARAIGITARAQSEVLILDLQAPSRAPDAGS